MLRSPVDKLLIGCNYLQVLVSVYCDLLEFYVKVRDIFANRDGKRSCEL